METRALTQEGREAHDSAAWDHALECYRAVEAAGGELSPEDLERMAVAAWLLADPATSDIAARAFEGYEAAGQVHDATRMALDLMEHHALLGEMAIAMGWFRRAGRMIAEEEEVGPGHARVAIMEGFMAILSGRVMESLEKVEAGHAIARRVGAEDIEALALSRRAALLLRLGRLEEAMADVDEAMLLVHRDKARPIAGAMIYCNTIDFCRDLGDYDRALEWTEAASRWIEERRVSAFPGVCRVHRAELLRLRGDHAGAEAEVRSALALFEQHRFRRGLGFALTELGLQHLELDALDAAQDAFRNAEESGHEPLPGAAILALRRGDPAGARAMLETALSERDEDPLGRTRYLPTLVEACLGDGDVAAADAAAAELEATAARFGTVGIEAQAQMARARVHVARGELAEAIMSARAATRAWNMLGARYELSRARDLLAMAYEANGDDARARMERTRAKSVRDSLSTASELATKDTQLADEDTRGSAPSVLPPPLVSGLPIREGMTLADKIAIGPVLGVGGMGIVHAGRHLVTGRDVAVKVLKRSACGDDASCARFLAEARACGRIRHPNVVDIYDAGMHGEEPYIVMELLTGRSLERMLAEGDLPGLEDALDACAQAARGVAAAHEAGVIHRDIKPGNIFVSERGVKVLDFGICKQPESAETRPGQIVGTPFYMAPEQLSRPDRIDARTDVYALGAVLFELLTGRPPFVAESMPPLIYAILNGPAPSFEEHEANVPEEVQALVLRALARERDARFASAAELADALRSASPSAA